MPVLTLSATVAGKHYSVLLVHVNWHDCLMINLLVLLWVHVLSSFCQFGYHVLIDLVISNLQIVLCVLDQTWKWLIPFMFRKGTYILFRWIMLNGLPQVIKEHGIDETAIGNFDLGPLLKSCILHFVCMTLYMLTYFMLHLRLFNFPWVTPPISNGMGSAL